MTGQLRPFEESLPMALLRARENAMRSFRPILADHGLTEQQWRVLRALTASPSSLEVGQLAAATSLLAPSLTRILSNLERRGLIARRPVEHDQRRAEIRLTSSGADLVDTIGPSSESIYDRIERTFGAERLRRLLRELDDLASLDLDRSRPAREAS